MYKSKKKKKNETKNYIPHTKRKRNIIPSKTSKNSMFFSIQKKKVENKDFLFVCTYQSVYIVYTMCTEFYFFFIFNAPWARVRQCSRCISYLLSFCVWMLLLLSTRLLFQLNFIFILFLTLFLFPFHIMSHKIKKYRRAKIEKHSEIA